MGCEGSSSPKTTAKKVLTCMQQKDYDGLVELIAVQGKDAKEEQEARESLKSLLKEKGSKEDSEEIESFNILDETIAEDGQTATVKYSVKYKGSNTERTEQLKMKKDKDGEWKVDMGK